MQPVSAQVLDSFGLVDPAGFKALLVGTLVNGTPVSSDVTSQLQFSSPDQGQTYNVSGSVATLPEGLYTFSLHAQDLAGNGALPDPLSTTFRVDRTPPAITLGMQDHILTNNPSLNLPVTVLDLSPITTTVLLNGAQVFQSADPSFTASLHLVEGPNVIEVDSVDAAGNAATPAKLSDVVLDTTPPVLSNLMPANGAIVQFLTFPVSGQSNEALSYAKVNGQDLLLSQDKKSFSGNFSVQTEGSYSLNFQAADLAGNAASATTSIQVLLKVLNGDLLSVFPAPDGAHLIIRGAPGATRPGLTVSASASFTNSGSIVAATDGSFSLLMLPFTQATVSATDPSINRTDTATVSYGPNSSTILSGSVLDSSGSPIAGATVSIPLSPLSSVKTDGNGVFVLSQPAGSNILVTGDHVLVVDGTTVPPAPSGMPQRKFSVTNVSISIGLSQSNVLQRPIYLVPIPLDGTAQNLDINSGNTSLTNPNAPGVVLNIPAGVATFPDGGNNKPVAMSTISAQYSTIAPMQFAQPKHVIALEPSGMKFSQPVDLTVPNFDNLPPGVELVILSMNSRKGIWEVDGAAQVSADGSSVITKPGMGITHFSTVYASPIGPTVKQIGAQDQPGANTFDGALSTSIKLPSYKSLGQDISPQLIYRSSWAKPTVLVTNLFDIPKHTITVLPPVNNQRSMNVNTCILFFCSTIDFDVYSQVNAQVDSWYHPEYVTARFFSTGITSDTMTYTGIPNRAAISYAMDLKDTQSGAYLPSGVYPYDAHYEMQLAETRITTEQVNIWTSLNPPQVTQENFTETRQLEQLFPQDLQGPMFIQNKIQSEAGKGWSIAGVQRIANPTGNRVLVEEGDGSISSYAVNNSKSSIFPAL